jgi:hypothetical protein
VVVELVARCWRFSISAGSDAIRQSDRALGHRPHSGECPCSHDRGRRELFLLDAAWFVVLALNTVYRFLTSSHSVTWAALIPLYAFCVLQDVKLYGDFAGDQVGELDPGGNERAV